MRRHLWVLLGYLGLSLLLTWPMASRSWNRTSTGQWNGIISIIVPSSRGHRLARRQRLARRSAARLLSQIAIKQERIAWILSIRRAIA